MVPTVDALVIGAGIGGLAVARELLGRGIPGHRIVVVGESLGGRLQTVTTAAGEHLEIGAGRYSRVLHPRLDRLVRTGRLAVDPFAFDVSHCTTSTPRQALNGFELADLPAGGSFLDALAARIGARAAADFVTATGYEALRDRDFPVAGGVEVASTHPECTGEPARLQWVRPHDGFGGLIDRLAAGLRRVGVRFRTGARVGAVRLGRDSVAVELQRGGWTLPHRITARTAVLAMATTEVDALELPADADLSWRSATRRIGLFKCFLVYNSPWWDALGLRQRCLITGDRMQKLYFDSARRSIFFYCDSGNSDYWARLTGAALEREAFHLIESAAGGHLPNDLRRPLEVHRRYWPAGIAYLTDDATRPTNGVVALTDNVLLTSDSLTDNPGWIESALLAAENTATLAAVRLGRPVAARALSA
jgi:monoamine oxidase